MRITIFFFILSIQNCPGQDTLFFDASWKATTKNLAAFYRIDKHVGQLWIRTDYYVPGNQLQMRGNFSSLDPEIKVGRFEYFHKNGRLQHEGSYLDDKAIGFHKWYHDNGNPEAIENYIDGKLSGDFKEFHENGNLSVETVYRDGAQAGRTIYYHQNGIKQSEGIFKDGDREGLWKFYDEKGKLISTHTFKTEYIIPEAKLFIKLPNSEWELDGKGEGEFSGFIFKRTPILDRAGLPIIPAIMVYVENASKYKKDVVAFSIVKRSQFKNHGLTIEQTLVHEDKDYPLSYKNGVFMRCSYKDKGVDHALYMIHIINNQGKGIQVYLDITKDLVAEYEQEFWRTIKSLREAQ